MRRRVRYRLYALGACVVISGAFLYYLSQVFKQELMFFETPTSLKARLKDGPVLDAHKRLRLGGVVKAGSIDTDAGGGFQFIVTDDGNEVQVCHTGTVPALFRERQGVVVEGYYLPEQKFFRAHRVLAKHDESYRIPAPKRGANEKTEHGP